jgi:hypothetical protein
LALGKGFLIGVGDVDHGIAAVIAKIAANRCRIVHRPRIAALGDPHLRVELDTLEFLVEDEVHNACDSIGPVHG